MVITQRPDPANLESTTAEESSEAEIRLRISLARGSIDMKEGRPLVRVSLYNDLARHGGEDFVVDIVVELLR